MQPNVYRRALLKSAAGFAALAIFPPADAATEFWNRKPPADWSADEVAQLLSQSPWSKEVNADFTQHPEAGTPRVGRGGVVEAPPQIQVGRQPIDAQAGARRRQPVIVRWESARPIREAGGIPFGDDLKDRYVISVSGLPLGIMEKGSAQSADAQRMVEQLSAAATLEATGEPPVQPGIVSAAPRRPGTWLFGFSKELLPLDRNKKQISFVLRTAVLTIRARFEPKSMLYQGSLAV